MPDAPPCPDVRIEPLGPDSNLEPLGRWLADPRIARGLNIQPRLLSERELSRYAAGFDGRSSVLLGVFSGDSMIGVATFDINPRHRTAAWTLAVGERDWRGIRALYAIGLRLFDWGFGPAGLEKVVSRVAANKLVLLHFLDELGVRREGYLRGEIKVGDGQRQDEVLHGLLRDEWPATRARLVARLTQPSEKIPTSR